MSVIPGLNAGNIAPSNTVVQNPNGGASVDYGNAGQAQIASANLAVPGQGAIPNAGYNPLSGLSQPASSGFGSSMQPLVNLQGNQGASSAFSSLTGNSHQSQPQSTGGSKQATSNAGGIDVNGFMQGAMNMIQSSTGQQLGALSSTYNLMLQNASLANQGIQLQYNTALGGLNQQYNQAFQQLQTQHMNSVGSSVAQLSMADPFGAQSSSFASGYIGKVNDLYNQQAGFLNAAYGQQQVALQNGEAGAAIAIQQQINSAQADFGQKVATTLATQNQAMLGIAQAGIGMAQFQQSRGLQSQSNFETALRGTNLAGVDPNASQDQLQQQFPNLFTEGQQAGFTPDQIASSIKTGTIAAKNTQLNQERLYAEFGNQGGGGGAGSGGATLSAWGQSLGNGGASIANHPEITNTLTNIASAASPGNLQSLTNYVQTGSSNTFTSAIGPIMNSFFGTNISNTTSSKDIGTALSENLGIPVDLAGLANQSAATRATVLKSILTSLQGKLQAKTQGYASTYNLGGLKSQMDQANTNLTQAISQLGSGAGTAAGLFNTLNQTSWGNFMGATQSSWFSK